MVKGRLIGASVFFALSLLTFSAASHGQVKVSPATVDFGRVAVNDTSSKSFSITNTSTLVVHVNAFINTDFRSSDSFDLPPGSTFTVNVAFSPTTLGRQAATLTVYVTLSVSPLQLTVPVSLVGTGIAPFTVSPLTLNFGNQLVGTTRVAGIVTLTNNLKERLTFVLGVISNQQFLIEFGSSTCVTGGGVDPSASCTFEVMFTPNAVGPQIGTLTVSSVDLLYLNSAIVSLKGTGTAPALASITVLPGGTLPLGGSERFRALGTFHDGSVEDLTTSVTWSSSLPSVATISNTTGTQGLVVSVAQGTTTIRASLNSIVGSTTLSVTAPALVSIAVTPANPSISIAGTEQFTATGTYSNASTQDLSATATWSSSATGVATITSSGLATGVALGSATIQATSGAVKGSTTLTVTAPALVSIAVTPVNPSISIAGIEQFTATGTYSNASTQDLSATATWSSSATGVATITSSGLATGVALGSATIQATSGAVKGSTTLTVASRFSLTGSLNTVRGLATSTLLNNGMVLVAGGTNATNSFLASAELYDPVAGTFTPTGSLNTARYRHTATLLANGMVLIAGGQGSTGFLTNAELYNPANGTFSPTTGPLNTARSNHTATLLNNGMVLFAGGFNSVSLYLNSAELYDPSTGSFTPTTGALNTAREDHTATLLNDGQVLVAGGLNGFLNPSSLGSAELYDPVSGTFTFASGSLNTARTNHTSTLLNNGMVLLVGGGISGANVNELYNPATGSFSVTGSLNTYRSFQTATLLNNGKVLIAGGLNGAFQLASAELYDPIAGTFAVTDSLDIGRQFHTATLLNTGSVLVVSGFNNGSYLATADLYKADTLTPSGLISITITPATPTLPPGTTQRFVAMGTFSDGTTLQLASATWESSNSAVATITDDSPNLGTAYAVAAGTAAISACAGSVCGLTTLTVGP